MNALALAAVVPAAIAWAAIALLRRSPLAARLADRPNARSLHTLPTPRLGGLGVVAGILPFAVAFADGSLGAMLFCALALALVSLADDFRSLPVEVRLPAHVVAAAVALLALAQPGAQWPWGWGGAIVAVLGIAWAANLFNFMDGADGLAGGMAAIGFAALAAAAAHAGFVTLAILCAATASAAAGFLVHNFPPARVFLGDSGSVPLGFLAGALGLFGVVHGAWPAWFPLLVFSPFWVDATVTLVARLARGERVWIAHREHGYQRLALAGWSRRRLAISAFALMVAVAASALAARWASGMVQCGILFFWAAAYGLIALAVMRPTRRKA